MMSVHEFDPLGSGGGQAKAASHYYSERGSDYYMKGSPDNEHEGLWIGKGSEKLGLTGGPEREELQLALAGYVAGQQVQNAGRPNRDMGWDLTFSAPKSVSLVWAFTTPEHRQEIRKAHRAAAKAAHSYLESQVTTRRGKAGKVHEPASLASAMFTHHTSRAGDPQLHSHVVVPNFCVRDDGTVGAITSGALFKDKLTGGALYQAELAYRMRGMGYGIELVEDGTFRLSGINERLERQFSKRSKDIERVSKERGIKTYKGTRKVVLSTRPAKKHSTLAEREATWRQEAKDAGLSLPALSHEQQGKIELDKEKRDQALEKSLAKLTEHNSTFRNKDLLRELARASYGELNARQVQTMATFTQKDERVKNIGRDKFGREVLTAPDMEGLERSMVQEARELVGRAEHGVDASETIKESSLLSEEQKTAVRVATVPSALAVIQGRAGAGKTTTLAAIRKAYERARYKVRGIALSGVAAQNLEKEAGIPSQTIDSWQRKPQIDERTVLVVDEAGTVGSRKMADILQKARVAGSKVILVGDERQLQPIDAGGALHAVDREIIKVRPEASGQIQTIYRQKEPWMQKVVYHAAEGKTAEALKALDERGKIQIYRNSSQAKEALVTDYVERHAKDQKDGIILTHGKGDASQINELVREKLQDKGLIGENEVEVHNGQRAIDLAPGDRVMMIRNNYKLDVRNGQRGHVMRIDEKTRSVSVRMDDGQDKEIELDKYKYLDYGWASTTYKTQGATVERAYVYGHTKESMASRQATYVQISRAREETKIYAVSGNRSTEREGLERELPMPYQKNTEEREKALKEMSKSWGQDRAKDTTLDYQRERMLAQQHQQAMDFQRMKEKARDKDMGMER